MRSSASSMSRAVSIHAPVKGATLMRRRAATKATVSIHAPVKGATDTLYREFAMTAVSIHAPVKGATYAEVDKSLADLFQSTRP